MQNALDSKADASNIPTKTSDLTNDSGFITSSSLPTKVSDLTNDSGFITNTVNNLTNYYTKTNTYTKSEVDSLISSISSLDIQIVQTLPTRDISTSTIYLVPKTASTNDNYDEYIYVNNSWEHIGSTEVDLSNYYTKTQTDNLLDDKADVSSLSTVATTGSYNDLSNKPTIPTVNNATLTIQKNGTTVKTFTANASSNVTANITVPTKTSDLTNDSGFVDNTYHDSSKQDTLVSGTNIKTINNQPLLGSGNIEVASDIDMFADTKNGTFYRANKKGIYWYTGATAFNLGIGASDISFSGNKILMFMQKIDADDVQNLQDNDTIGYALGLEKLDSNDGEVEILSNYYIIKYDSSTSSKTKLINGNGMYIDGLTSITHISNNYYNKSYIDTGLSSKQDTLVSGTNIKTINNESILGSGNINIQGGGSGGTSTDVKINGTSITSGDTANIAVEGTYNASTNKLMTKSEVDGYDASWIYTPTPSVADFNAFYNYVENGGIRVYVTSQDDNHINTTLVENVKIGGPTDNKYIDISSGGGLFRLICDGTQVTTYSFPLYEESRNKVTLLSRRSKDYQYPSAKCVYDNLATKADTSSLSTVATSGNYNDLTNKPTIPVVPTNISSFTNDSNYQNATQVQTAINNAIGTALNGSY